MNLKTIGYAAIMTVATAAFVIGAAGTSEAAKAKAKKAAAAPHKTATCLNVPMKPVCGTMHGMKFTYANSCYAGNDGAMVTSQKACASKKMGGKKMAKAMPAKKKAAPAKKK